MRLANFQRVRGLDAQWKVDAPTLDWQIIDANADAFALLPRMETDVCLRSPGRAIILDTKFYAIALKSSSFGPPRLPSANLYQLFTYLRQRCCEAGSTRLIRIRKPAQSRWAKPPTLFWSRAMHRSAAGFSGLPK